MKIKPPLLLYFVACLFYMVSVCVGNGEMMLLSKPVIIPSMLFYYIQETKQRINWNYIVIIFLCFIGDMLTLLDIEGAHLVIISVFLIAYCFYLKSITDDLLLNQLKITYKKNFLVLLICFFFLIYLLITILDLLVESQAENLLLLLFYGIVLVLIGGVSSFNYILKQTRFTFFMLIATLCFVISDVFYILRAHFEEVEVFSLFNNLPQVLSYYYLTKYYILKPAPMKR
ncbi:lysoplasmalogenase family protein [Flavobacterium suncheonense]|uniref:YhhN-like protein n=1 Tax=Flavobacterium suncheonense GH29-5 = DSM 17707 TaxID=1121899 RepID=A0A0A2MGQ4_9FLAO|nr:lysoplasmalogenase family protein [Flavobacterium suncheonense]KGO90756.1 hypothetical protein Q764_01145 [Flavobacterium suncheonense GH29-5 = DSM 17707]